jgi:poly(3-hydroxybutyrate) depolymerase
MLAYYAHDGMRAALAGPRAGAAFGRALAEDEGNPFRDLPVVKAFAASMDVFERLTRLYKKPEWNIQAVKIDGHNVPIKQEVVDETPFYRLVKLSRDSAALTGSAKADLTQKLAGQPRGVLLAPMSGHNATLLRGTATEMLKSGDVYVTEWKSASTVPVSKGDFGVAENVEHIIRALTVAGPGSHLTAVCQPCPAAVAAVSFMSQDNHPCKPRSLTLMAGPLDTSVSPQKCNEAATTTPLWAFEAAMLHAVPPGHAGVNRIVMPGFLQQTAFVSQNLAKHGKAHTDYFLACIQGAEAAMEKHREFYDEYNALLDLHAKFYKETIQWFFQENRLANGTLEINGRRVDVSNIDVPVLVVEGGKDDICGIGQTLWILDQLKRLPAAKKAYHLEEGAGHFGVFNGSGFRDHIAPLIAAWQAQWDGAALKQAA